MSPSSSWSVDHIGIAVNNLDDALSLYASTLGGSVTHRERLETQGVEVAFVNTGPTTVELLAPLTPDSHLGRFLGKRGPGLHHICYRVKDIEAEIQRLQSLGATLLDTTPRAGAGGTRIAFVHPSFFLGTLTELCEYPTR